MDFQIRETSLHCHKQIIRLDLFLRIFPCVEECNRILRTYLRNKVDILFKTTTELSVLYNVCIYIRKCKKMHKVRDYEAIINSAGQINLAY